jgi:Domain of unknown function (DUF4258)
MAVGKFARVTYAPHALDQMRKRLIGEGQVERTIAQPDRTAPSVRPLGRIVAERVTAAGNTLRVVYVEFDDGAEAHVVTVIRIRGSRR